jgi:hypothetical protein
VTPDEEVDQLLAKAVGRLHAVKDDLYRCGQLDGDDHYCYVLAARTAALVNDLNRLVAERKRAAS